MSIDCDHGKLIEALRNEIQEYGELLTLFNEQEKAIIERSPNLCLATQQAIALQLGAIAEYRTRREESTKEIAEAVGQAPGSPLRSLIDSCPEEVSPLLHALLDEVSHLILRTNKRAQQNQALLARAEQKQNGRQL